jgi:hypothetical protein
MAHVDMSGLVTTLKDVLSKTYPDLLSAIYFGDVGVYPPSVFKTANGERRSILAIIPDYDRLETRAPNADLRRLGVNLVCMVDMTPFFEATPPEAYGESILVETAETLRGFLAQDANFNLGGRVLASQVTGIDWAWTQRMQLSIRAAAVKYEVKVNLPRL